MDENKNKYGYLESMSIRKKFVLIFAVTAILFSSACCYIVYNILSEMAIPQLLVIRNILFIVIFVAFLFSALAPPEAKLLNSLKI